MALNQNDIDNLSDLLQGRNSEHKQYPYGHPKYKLPADSPLSFIPGLGTRVTIEFASEAEAKKFGEIFKTLDKSTRERTMQHFKEIGKVEHGV